MRKNQRLAIAVICAFVLTLLRVFFTVVFFVTSVICIVNAESRVERCDGHVTLSQIAVDSLNTTSTFVETAVSSFLIFLIYRWKQFNFKNFLKALPRQGDFWMWTTLWIARICTNVLIDIIPGINQNYPVLIVLGVSLSFEFASTTILACALTHVQFRNMKEWFAQHFPRQCAYKLVSVLYRGILFTYGLRMLALFLYDSFLVARNITRQSEYRELDSVLLALDVGYRGSLSIFFFRKFFDFALPDVFEETNADLSSQMKPERNGSEEKEQIATCSESVLPEARENEIAVKEVELQEEAGSVFNKSTEDLEVGYSTRKDNVAPGYV